jgi:hypothetical protein
MTPSQLALQEPHNQGEVMPLRYEVRTAQKDVLSIYSVPGPFTRTTTITLPMTPSSGGYLSHCTDPTETQR